MFINVNKELYKHAVIILKWIARSSDKIVSQDHLSQENDDSKQEGRALFLRKIIKVRIT